MLNNQDVIIEKAIKETYMVFKLNSLENKTIIELLTEIDKYYTHTMFTNEASDNIMNFIKADADKQDIILDFINTIYFKLKVLQVDTEHLFSIIKDTTKTFTSSKDLDKDYIEQIVPDTDYLEGIVLKIVFLIKIYGIASCLEVEGA